MAESSGSRVSKALPKCIFGLGIRTFLGDDIIHVLHMGRAICTVYLPDEEISINIREVYAVKSDFTLAVLCLVLLTDVPLCRPYEAYHVSLVTPSEMFRYPESCGSAVGL